MIRLLKFFWWSLVAIFCGLLLGLSGAFLYLSPSLPSVDALRSIQLQIPLRVYSSDGKLIAEIIPELWLMDHYNVQLSAPYQEEVVGDLADLTAKA